MRPIARQSVRLASSSRARRSPRKPYLPQQQHVRSFSRSSQHAIDTRGPNEPPDHTKPIEVAREEQRHRKDAEQEFEKDKISGEGRSIDESKLAVSKTRRQRRKEALAPDIPKPPPIPDWFLNHNVKLQEDTARPDLGAKSAQVLRCIDSETGHTLFALPYYEAWPMPVKSDTPGSVKSKKEQSKKLDSFFDQKFAPGSSSTKPTSKTEATPTFIPTQENTEENSNPHTLLRWAILEAECAIRAGFVASANASQASLTAASRVDISLQCPDGKAHQQMDELVEDLAAIVQADLIRLDANDFEDLLSDYVGQGSDSPGSFSNLAYDVFDGLSSQGSPQIMMGRPAEEEEDDEMDEDDEDDENDNENDAQAPSGFGPAFTLGTPQSLNSLRKALSERRNDLSKALGMRISGVSVLPLHGGQRNPFQAPESTDPPHFDDARLKALLDNLLDAPKSKQAAASTSYSSDAWHSISKSLATDHEASSDDKAYQALFRFHRSSPGYWLPDVAGVLVGHLTDVSGDTGLKVEPLSDPALVSQSSAPTSRTIVHVRDLKYLSGSRMGESIIHTLVRAVQKRRRAGQEIMIVGTTARDRADSMFVQTGRTTTDQDFRSIAIPPFFNASKEDLAALKPGEIKEFKGVFGSVKVIHSGPPIPEASKSAASKSDRRVLEINLRHLRSMLSRLRPNDAVDLFTERSLRQIRVLASNFLGTKVLPFEDTQRIALTAIGLAQVHAVSDTVNASHIGLAIHLLTKADQLSAAWTGRLFQKSHMSAVRMMTQTAQAGDAAFDEGQGKARIEKIKKTCNQHETRLLPGVVDASNIKTGFNEVHAPAETIDALKTLTSLSLLRPEAFKYGVLAADRLPGLMLYGPPGTGKTLLAKAVAKESRATVLEISGAQIYEKYVGEGEKMVRAVFSLAKKLSPCVVFIDEADAIFGSRNSAGNRNTHREIINQFLREWDGMENHNVFIMVASNRPFDMDDAVLRRLPRRLLVDLPVAKDRESILKIHLKDETLDESVKLNEIAANTPLYSGSDLKNLCVAAALACVREENDLATSKADDKEFKLPEKRTLYSRHFEQAVKEISASISEDMGSLTGIRKFDEQYGERRGRKKKTAYGFGMGGDGLVDENSVRVRQSDDHSSAPPP